MIEGPVRRDGTHRGERRLAVAICSHNPRPEYLSRVLIALRAQTLGTSEWELILVDNASHEHLDSYDLTWHPHHAHIREETLGLTSARVRAIQETRADLIVFVDDDNVLAPEYLERALSLAAKHSRLGVFGAGVINPEFEAAPSSELAPWLHSLLALRSVEAECWTNDPREYRCVPCGAGLCVRSSVAKAYVECVGALRITEVLDRIGERLFGGGDDLFSFTAARSGWGVGLFPELHITHLIPENRLRKRYLRRLVHDHAYAHAIREYRLYNEQPPVLGFLVMARILLHGIRRGPLSMRYRWAAALGAQRAARFIGSSGLEPLEDIVLSGQVEGARSLGDAKVANLAERS